VWNPGVWNRGEALLIRELCDKTLSWLSAPSEAAGAVCDKVAESLLSFDQPHPTSYFAAAQSAWLRGQPEVAIARLKKVVDEQGDKDAPLLQLPVSVMGRLWIASILRYSDSLESARDTYAEVLALISGGQPVAGLEWKTGVMAFCHLYIAEIEADHLGNREKALSHLRRAEAIATHSVYGHWAQYERTRLAHGKAEANRQLSGDLAMMPWDYAAALHFTLTGLTVGPLADPPDVRERIKFITEAIRKRVLEKHVSRSENTIMHFSSAHYYELTGDLSEAAKRYAEVFEEDSFVSPVAGIYAARMRKAEGKAGEAKELLQRVCSRYPRFESSAKSTEESWK